MFAPRAAAILLLGIAPALAQGSDVVSLRPTDHVGPEIVLPPVPEVQVEVPPSRPAAASSAFELPLPPAAAVTLTADDLISAALAKALSEPAFEGPKRLRKAERDAIAAFYATGGYKPLFVEEGRAIARAAAVAKTLEGARADGLAPEDYLLPEIVKDASHADLAAAELRFAGAVVLYARDARGARIDPGRLSRLITPRLELPSADAVLTDIAASAEPGAALAAYQPRHAGYLALKAKLAELRAAHALPAKLEGDIVANMERWRWLPTELGRRHIFVNVPEYKLRLFEEGREIHEARVIVGKPDTQTPIFSDEMDHAVVNPSWYVPPSIFRNEFHSDPALAAAKGYDVRVGRNGQVSVRQPPGERNALGFIKFMFPNDHAVYIHDTPNRNLFNATRRAFSHGCVRLDQPFRFADFVLGAQWTEKRLRGLIGRGEQRINLPEKIPVHLAYFTTFIENGELRQVPDIYATSNKVRVALGYPSDGTAVAAAPKPKPRPQPRAAYAAGGTARPVPAQAPAPPAPAPFFPLWMSR